MKKLTAILVMITILFTASAFADDFSDRTDPFGFATFADAVKATGGEYIIDSKGYAGAVIEKDGHLFRAVAFFDERAEELYAAYSDAWQREDGSTPDAEALALSEHIMTMPVQYTEELTAKPLTQEELDAMAGKTIGEVMAEPWEMQMCNYPEDAEVGKDVVFPMVKGYFNYELVINEPFEVYQERRAADQYDPVTEMSLQNYLDLTVQSVKYTGVSNRASDRRYQADGTFIQETDPEGYEYDVMLEIADILAAAWENGEPDQETKEALIVELTEKYPKSADMIRQMVESFH